jgi:general secretion pathway protein G
METLRSPHAARKHAGFTLIELIVVLTLIALLLTIAVPRYFSVVDAGKVKVRRQNIAVMRDALDKYNGDQGRYPDRLQDLVDKRYLREIPIDPVSDSFEWVIVAPPSEREGAVFDVQPPAVVNADGAPPTEPSAPATPPAPDVAPAATATTPEG